MRYARGVGAKPDVQLLANGDILVPVKDGDGGWQMSRVAPEESDYAGWLKVVQRRDRGPGPLARSLSFWIAAVIVFLGIVVILIVISLLVSHGVSRSA